MTKPADTPPNDGATGQTDPPVTPVRNVDVDSTLQLFAALAEKHETEFGITLTMPGGLVSGILVGRTKWAELLTDTVRSASGDDSGTLGDVVSRWVAESVTEPEDPDDLAVFSYGFLHLRNAVMFPGSTQVPTAPGSFLWRGRIGDVAGWAMGNIAST